VREIELQTTARRQLLDVTAKVDQALSELGARDGVCHLWVPHTTAAVIVNENADPDVGRDLLAAYEALVPGLRFAHGEGNSDAHLLATLLGSSLTVPVQSGRLHLGTWQGVYFAELDGPRRRRLWVSRG
jgi:secondary thiamine-phosphate synthase enzyme